MNPCDFTAVYTGSFDPYHLGHDDIVRRAAALFQTLIIGVGENPEKTALFSIDERVVMMREVLADVSNVHVVAFEGLTVHFVRARNARILLRGIRALVDIEYEFTMSLTNATLDPNIESVFLMAHKEYTHLSSTLIRQIARLGGDLRGFVPPLIVERLKAKVAGA